MLDVVDWGAEIRRFRRATCFKQSAVAEALSVDQATVSRWERNVSVPDLAMQRRLRVLIRRPVSDEFLLKHVVSISLGQIVLSNVDRVMQAVSLGYSTGHGMPQSEMLGMPTHRMYTEESERLWQTSHDHGFYRGEVASGWLFPAGRPEC